MGFLAKHSLENSRLQDDYSSVYMNITGYNIDRQIGKGGMSIVYLAIQESLCRPVALKVLNPLYADTPEFSERFLNEGRLLASLNHNHIITIHDIGISNGLHFISMEYVDGGDLRDRINQVITPDTAIDYTYTIASSLQAAHRAHIVHRDIKPANILFRRDGTLLLSDFGIAKHLASTKELTGADSLIGSPHYLSPEQALGQPVDGRSDIYSLGIMLYEMLLGTRPFEGSSDVDVAVKHITEEIPLLPETYADYQQLLHTMTARNPDERFPSMGSLLKALDEIRASGQWSGEIVQVQDVTSAGLNESTDSFGEQHQAGSESETVTVMGGIVSQVTDSREDATLPNPESTTQITLPPARWHMWQIASAVVFMLIVLVLGVSLMLVPVPEQSEDVDNENPEDVVQQMPVATVVPAVTQAQLEARLKAEMEAEQQRKIQQQIQNLLQKANKALARYYLTYPKNNSAYDYYRQVLKLDPGNKDAKQGLNTIADRYYSLARNAVKDWEYNRARQFVERGLRVKPKHGALKKMQGELKKTENTLGTRIKKAIKGLKEYFERNSSPE